MKKNRNFSEVIIEKFKKYRCFLCYSILIFILLAGIVMYCKKYNTLNNLMKLVRETFKNTTTYDIFNTDLYYINLLERTDRKNQILEELKNINYPEKNIHRVDAIKMSDGSLGCGLSHIKTLYTGLYNKGENDFIIVMEDDFMWKIEYDKIVELLNKAINFKDWNVILLACNGKNTPFNEFLNKTESCQTASGYIIKKSYIPSLLNVWENNMEKKRLLNDGILFTEYNHENTCIDQCWKKLQNDNWYTIKPVIGKQRPSWSDIEKVYVDYKV